MLFFVSDRAFNLCYLRYMLKHHLRTAQSSRCDTSRYRTALYSTNRWTDRQILWGSVTPLTPFMRMVFFCQIPYQWRLVPFMAMLLWPWCEIYLPYNPALVSTQLRWLDYEINNHIPTNFKTVPKRIPTGPPSLVNIELARTSRILEPAKTYHWGHSITSPNLTYTYCSHI